MIPIRDDNPAHRPPIVTVAFIAVCVVVFLWQVSLDPRAQEAAVYSWGMIPAVLLGEARLPVELARVPPVATLVTSMFLHGGWGHLLGNMLYLWIFGNNIEDRLGHGRFVLFYLACGLAAAGSQILPEPGSRIPMIGASGAISGVLGAYMLLYPHARVLVLIPLGFMFLHQVRAVWLLGVWFTLQIVSALAAPPGAGGVAWWAHVGGFVAGLVLALPLRRRVHRRGPWG